MHISKVSLINYRNFPNAKFVFKKGVNTIIGENGSGKTNVFRAIRLLLDDSMPRSSIRMKEGDFSRNLENWRGHWIIISLEFDDLSTAETIQSLFLHSAGTINEEPISKATYNLIFRPDTTVRKRLSELNRGDKNGLRVVIESINLSDYECIITGKSTADFNDLQTYKEIVGDFEEIQFPEELNGEMIGVRINSYFNLFEDISFTFIKALRDVISEFHNSKRNPLFKLLKGKSDQINKEEFEKVVGQVKELNSSIEGLTDVEEVRSHIHQTVNDAAGETYAPEKLSIKSDLSEEEEQLFQSLALSVGESGDGYEGPIHELSLGGANLIYLTLKLLEFKYQQQKESFANFLLIEEPEAHIHTHIQKTLFNNLEFPDTQIIYSTHSTHISDVSNIENMNIIGRVTDRCEVFQPASGLIPKQIRNVQRYLDAIRSSLLFAKSVILVEGDAEEILIPIIIKKVLGISPDELGISLINIRSTGFENVALLFHDDRIRKRCAIITDLDAAFIDTTAVDDDSAALKKAKKKAIGSQTKGLARKEALNDFVGLGQWIETFFTRHTFEIGFISAGNAEKVVKIVEDVYEKPTTKANAKNDLRSDDISRYGTRVLTMAKNQGKGWFAVLLGDAIDSDTIIPDYICEALAFAHGTLSRVTCVKIVDFRLKHNQLIGVEAKGSVDELRRNLEKFSNDKIDIDVLLAKLSEVYPNDPAINMLAHF